VGILSAKLLKKNEPNVYDNGILLEKQNRIEEIINMYEDVLSEMMSFVESSPTAFHAVSNIQKMPEESG